MINPKAAIPSSGEANPVHSFFHMCRPSLILPCSETPTPEARVPFLKVWPGYRAIQVSPPRSETSAPLAHIFSTEARVIIIKIVFLFPLVLGMVGVAI